MSSGAVAASDPGGGEPKLVAGADVVMTEAAGQAAAPAADVKAEKAAVAVDDVQEGAVASVNDPLHATEAAGMVSGDEPLKGAEGVNGGGGGEASHVAGAGGLLSEEGRKPAPGGDVAAAAGGQALEAAGSATSEHAEAESNKLEENHINAEHGRDNKEVDNGVVHSDKEIQNNIPGDIEGSSKILEDDVAPATDQPDDGSEMLPQTEEQFPGYGDNPGSDEAASPGNVDHCARYCLPPLDKCGFEVSDLVWGKVKSHPWWPGEIFDPSVASELALKHQKKGSYLVAYFGDNTFAWCDESQLKPFVPNYSQMEKQNSSDAFVGSVNNALEELSRRILSGMSCSCLPEELCDNGMSYTVENAGLKDGVTCSAVNRLDILKCFSPENLLHYIKELALFPGQGGDLLELVIACSQLTSFNRSKGCSELASFQSGDAWVEDDMDAIPTQNVIVEETAITEVHPTHDKPKRGRGRPRKQKPEDNHELMEKKDTHNRSNDAAYDEKQMVMDFDDFDNLQNKKKRSFDSFEDAEKSSTPTGGSSFKIGECIRRAASQLTGSSSIVKAQNEPTVYKNAAEAENGEFDISSDDGVDELNVVKRAKRRRMHRNHTADPKELLSQLCLVATEPMNGYNFSSMIISYFNDYRNYIVSTTTEANIIEKGSSRRGRKRKEVLPSPEVETTDHMQDSYWSGLSLHNHPIHDLRKESSTTRPRRRRRSIRQTYIPLSELGASVPKKQIQVMERSIIHVDEKMVDELKPTALVLTFGRSAAIPSEMDLIKMFSRYGPLKETETEVHKGTNTVKVVFKKRTDADRAFSAAGKYGTFGPSLRSYRLVNMPFSLSTLEANNPVTRPEDCGTEIPVSSKFKALQDAMEVDQVNKSHKIEIAEAVGKPSVEQVEAVKQAYQVEAAGKAFVNQAEIVEKTGQIDAEIVSHGNEIGTAIKTESVAEASEETGNVKQDYTLKEASTGGLPEIAQSESVTGASSGGVIDTIQLGEAPNKAPIDDKTSTVQMEASSKAQNSHSDATIRESPQCVSDDMQVDIVAEAPKQSHISGDNAVLEAVTEVPITARVDTEADTANEVPEEHMVSPELQSQTSNEKPVEQDSNGQKVVSETPKQVSDEVPCSSKLEAEMLTSEPVGQGAVEQVEIQESKTTVEVSGEHVNSIEQTVQVESVTETSGGKTEVERQTLKDESMVDGATGHLTFMVELVEAKVVSVEENVDNVSATMGLVEETVEGEATEEAAHEKIENKGAVDISVGESKEGEITVEAPDEKTENKAIAEPITEETETAKAPDEGTRAAKETVEDVKALDNKTLTAEKSGEGTTVMTSDEKTTSAEKIVEDAMIEPADMKITEAEKTTPTEKTEDALVEPLDEKTTTAEMNVEDAMGEPPHERTTTAEMNMQDAIAEPPDVKATETEETMEGAAAKAPDKKVTATDDTTEDTTVEAPDPDVEADASE